MNRGGNLQSTRGFTVVETLIVLAVTSGLFILTAVAINGKQQKTDFQVGSRNLQQQFQQIINEAATGYYPSNTSFQCTVGIGANLQLTGGSNNQGENRDCTFIGKALVVGGDQHTDNYSVFSLAGRRVLSDGVTETRNPTEAKVTALSNAVIDTEQNVRLPNGLTFVGAGVGGALSNGEFAVNFMSSFSSFSGAGADVGGSQRLELRGYNNWSTGPSNDADAINREVTIPPNFPLIPGVEMCFRSNGTNQSVLITISDGMAVSYKIRGGITCAP
jgi:type II secretory pathway pseudopilin PulG